MRRTHRTEDNSVPTSTHFSNPPEPDHSLLCARKGQTVYDQSHFRECKKECASSHDGGKICGMLV
ncbi:hypothetical protein SCHPADRAFT_910609 [Schizopora paradoxa]|uniref:Uncharacterized protein n=1 Tax=Schizopora paradoxa TaxID=27342 RepID=A0A0H2R2L6_9AGAM|nr:hypothetical protein SCHPADRAFT_910609 [Schizopora paradoxa]